MREDFVTRLQLQLRDAAEREARGGLRADVLRGARRLRSPELAGALAVAVLAVALVAGALALRGEDTPPAGPAVVAQLELTGNPQQALPAFGSLWISDRLAGDVVRVDPVRRRVIARVEVGSADSVFMAAVGRELWVSGTEEPRVLRIDTATNAVRGSLPLRTPDGRPFSAQGLLASDRAVWAVNTEGALRLDPDTGAPRRLAAEHSSDEEARLFALSDEALWKLSTDGSIRRMDPLTGANEGRLRPGLAGTEVIGSAGADLIAGNGTTVARLDGASGSVVWERRVGDQVNADAAADGLLWVHSTEAGRDRMTALALDDGEVVASLPLDTFGSTGLAAVGREVWVNTPGGTTLVVRR